jgi:drug/metabolite transporter (DMT)-like permease
MAVFGFLILGERMTTRKIVAVALSIAGVLVITGASVATFGLETLAGDLLMVGSTLTWSLYTVYSRRTVVGMDPLVATVATMGAGLLFIILPTIGEAVVIGMPTFSATGIAAVVFLGACGAGLALVLWNYGLRRVEASVAAPLANLEAVVGVTLAAAIGETITGGQLLGGAVVLTGAVIGSLAHDGDSASAPGRRGTVPATTRRAGGSSPPN